MNPRSQIIGLEQNDRGTRLLIVTRDGRVRGAAFETHQALAPQPGRLEYDPAELWYKAKKVIAAGLDIHRTDPAEIAAIALAAQRGAVLAWNRQTGEPYYNAIAAADARAEEMCERLRGREVEAELYDKTGLALTANLPALKLGWLLEQVPGLRAAAEQGTAVCGGLDTWLLWHLTGATRTDLSQAAATGLLDLDTLTWDAGLLDSFGISPRLLPDLAASADAQAYGRSREGGPFGGEVPLASDLAIPQVSLLGAGCFERGEALLSGGEPPRILLHTGTERVRTAAGAATVAYAFAMHRPAYALELSGNYRDAQQRLGLQVVSIKTDGTDQSRAAAELLRREGVPVPVRDFPNAESAALGACYAAGLAVGFWKSMQDLRELSEANQ